MRLGLIKSIIAVSFALACINARAGEVAGIFDAPKDVTLEISKPSLAAGSLEQAVRSFGDPSTVLKLVVDKGEINAADCRFIRDNMTSLQILVVGSGADFTGGVVPKSAFEGLKSLRAVHFEKAAELGSKAFSLCNGLEVAELPAVTKTGVQAFAQAKGSSDARLRIVELPSLRELGSRSFYYCTALEKIVLGSVPKAVKPEGKEGLWFERVSSLVITVPDKKTYEDYLQADNCINLDWSAFDFVAANGEQLPRFEEAASYDDAALDCVRKELLPHFDRSDKDFSGEYYTGDYKFSLNMYTFNQNLNAALGGGAGSIPPLDTKKCIEWAASAGFDAVDITCYYIPGYSNTTMPTRPEAEILRYARELKSLCKRKHIAISGTGVQNNFSDPNRIRRETDIQRIKFWIKVAAEMGAPVIRVFAGPPPADIRREGWEKIARERIVPAIQEVADYARDNYPGVRIGLQNHGGMLSTANQVIQVLGWINRDNVGIVNDTGFYRDFLSTDARNYNWYRDIALVLPYTSNFQLKKKPAGAETSGLMDLERVARDIRMSPYRGYIPLELLWVAKDEDSPAKLDTPPYEETKRFLAKVKAAFDATASPVVGIGDDVSLQSIDACISIPPGVVVSAISPEGRPRTETETLQDGDVLKLLFKTGKVSELEVQVWREELQNYALGLPAGNIKVSSISKGASRESAFDGVTTGTSGSGMVFDKSQTGHPDKSLVWLAADLGQTRRIDAFGIAWGTSVGNLRKRLENGAYSVFYTEDKSVWDALSDAPVAGKEALEAYRAPSGWQLMYSQDASELPDANGNKIFIQSLDKPVSARYIMICGKARQSTVEIYNVMAFGRHMIRGNAAHKSYPVYSKVDILPVSPGMRLSTGVPALAHVGAAWPSFYLCAEKQLALDAVLSSNGRIVASRSIALESSVPVHLSFEGTIPSEGLYEVGFVIREPDGSRFFDKRCFTAIPPEDSFEACLPLALKDDRLVYFPDYKGNRVPEFSHAGYKGGGTEIPDVPVKVILSPGGSDDADRIQEAIDLISLAPADENGFRGALLLKAGTFRISHPLYVRTSGIVVKGEGDGAQFIEHYPDPIGPDNWRDYSQIERQQEGVTRIVATWVADAYDKSVGIFNMRGTPDSVEGASVEILDQYLPVGAREVHVRDASEFSSGDNVILRRAVSAAWAADLRMDAITEAPGVFSANQWAKGGKIDKYYQGNSQERTVASVDVERGTVTLAEPVCDPLDMRYGISYLVRSERPGRISFSGIEGVQLLSTFDKEQTGTNSAFGIEYKYFSDECHAQVGVVAADAQDIWVRNVTTYHLDVAVSLGKNAKRITLQDVNCLDPVSGTGGERRYSFTNSGASFVLNNRCYARYTRHAFIVMGQVNGPNVFLDGAADWQFDASEPHLRWSSAGLFDNVRSRIYVQNRWNNGTAHGWAGSNYVLYNCDGYYIVSSSHLTPNYVFGQLPAGGRLPYVMDAVDPGHVPNFKAVEYNTGKKMEPRSLYLQQLKDRLGADASNPVSRKELPAVIDDSEGFESSFAFLSKASVGSRPLKDFKATKTSYSIDVPIDWTSLPEIKVKGDRGVLTSMYSEGSSVICSTSAPGKTPLEYVFDYSFVPKDYITDQNGKAEGLDALNDGSPKTSWSQSGNPYVQFYLGDKSKTVVSVTLGYCRNTQSRRQYYFDFEISDDGYHWTKVFSPDWTPDNLGKSHIMGMVLSPGVGNKLSDQETFQFPEGVTARLLKVSMHGCRMGQGSGSTNANAYWMIEVKTK